MKLNRTLALAALAVALAAPLSLSAQAAGGSAPHAHGGHHAQHAPGARAAHHGEHGAGKTGCAHGAGEHAPTPAMLLGHHRADLGLTDVQVRRLQALKQDDAPGARAVLSAEQRAKLDRMHAATARTHAGGGHEHGAGCCKDGGECRQDGKCCGEDCCKEGRCTAECRDCCERSGAAAKGGEAAPRS